VFSVHFLNFEADAANFSKAPQLLGSSPLSLAHNPLFLGLFTVTTALHVDAQKILKNLPDNNIFERHLHVLNAIGD